MLRVSNDTLAILRSAYLAARDAQPGSANMAALQDAITLHDAEERLLIADEILRKHTRQTSLPQGYSIAPVQSSRPNRHWFKAPNGQVFGPYYTFRALNDGAWEHAEDPDFQPPDEDARYEAARDQAEAHEADLERLNEYIIDEHAATHPDGSLKVDAEASAPAEGESGPTAALRLLKLAANRGAFAPRPAIAVSVYDYGNHATFLTVSSLRPLRLTPGGKCVITVGDRACRVIDVRPCRQDFPDGPAVLTIAGDFCYDRGELVTRVIDTRDGDAQ